MVIDCMREIAGDAVTERFVQYRTSPFTTGGGHLPTRVFFGNPLGLDRMTVVLPDAAPPAPRGDRDRLRAALPDLGALRPEQPRRRAAPGRGARASTRTTRGCSPSFRDRLEPVAVIPTFTPDEAVAELDHAVGTLGLQGGGHERGRAAQRPARRLGRRVGRHARPREPLRLRPGVGEVRGARRRARVPRHRLRLGQPGVVEELRPQPPRQLRRRPGGGVPFADHGRRAPAPPGAAPLLPRRRRGVGGAAVRRSPRPLREAQPGRGAAVRPGARSTSRMAGELFAEFADGRAARLPGSRRRGRPAVGRLPVQRATASTTSPSRGSPAPTTSSTSSPASSASAARPTTR